MGACWFVQPESDRIALSDGQWLEVKRELTAGEQRQAQTGYLKEARVGERPIVDYERYGKVKILAYITAWSLKGFDGQSEPFNETALDMLDMDHYLEIERAIDAHEARVSARREARKNGQDGATTSPAISPSRSAVAGALSGSAI
jgi:hypothetical protein